MTEEDIRRQKADALFAHREASERAAHVREKVRSIGAGIRMIGARLEGNPEEFLPEHEITDDHVVKVRRLLPSATPTPEVADIVNMDSIVALAKELNEANRQVSQAAKNARSLGVSV